MTHSEMQRLIKLEDAIQKIISDELKLDYIPIEWDIVPYQKMLEIMSYNIPGQISSWKFGRNYERNRTIYEETGGHMPYEVIIFTNPARAFLMNTNTLAVQILIMAHCFGHSTMFNLNSLFKNNRYDIIDVMSSASDRINRYEVLYGIDEVERTIDAGHSIQLHSSPFHNETVIEQKQRIIEQQKIANSPTYTMFSDILVNKKDGKKITKDEIKLKTPLEPTSDLLRYIIDNSTVLDDWQRDILETLRTEGQYYWPMIYTKLMNEGFATIVHEKVINRLFNLGLISSDEYGQCNYANSLVKARNYLSINPYLVGCAIFEDIIERWDKGRYGREYDECTDYNKKMNWNTNENNGWNKVIDVVRNYIDWFFVQEFLTTDLIDKIGLYLYKVVDNGDEVEYVRTTHTVDEIRDIIVMSYADRGLPMIEIVNGNYNDSGGLYMRHRYTYWPLEKSYAIETMKHIYYLWGKPVYIETISNNKEIVLKVDRK